MFSYSIFLDNSIEYNHINKRIIIYNINFDFDKSINILIL